MTWIPCSGLETAEGLVWLPRLLQKARRCQSQSTSSRLTDGYCYGQNDFIDKFLLRFLRTDDSAVSALLRQEADDAVVTRALVEQSGRSPQECRQFSNKMCKLSFNFALLEADEGRMQPGMKRALIRGFYNRLMMPIVYAMFRRDEAKRASA